MQTDKRLSAPSGNSEPFQVTAGVAAIRETPAPDGRLATQALHGEILDVYEERGEFGHVQCRRDGYIGWALMAALSAPVLAVTHKISALRTYVYAEPDLKSAPRYMVCRGASVVVEGDNGDYVQCARAGWVHKRHITAVADARVDDPAAVAETYVGTPYLWGGRESLGLDCTGLTQQAFEAAGILLPRDSDMQYNWCGAAIDDWRAPGALQRNDLVFWKGHVGLMLDSVRMIHANAWHMAVAIEPLDEAIVRIKTHYAEPIGARRIDLSAWNRLPDWR